MLRLTILALLVLIGPARALESAPVASAHATVTLVSGSDTVGAGPVRLGLRFRLALGWHIYWRNPGDAGTAPELSLTLVGDATSDGLAWPVPERLREGPVMTYGYTGEVTLPVTVTPTGPGREALTVEAEANWLVCERVCVPESGRFRLTLPPGPAAPSAQAPILAAAEARLPVPSPFPARIAPDGTLSLSGDGLSPATVHEAWFFPQAWGALDQAAPQTLRVRGNTLTLALPPGPSFDPKAELQGVLVLRDAQGGESGLQVAAMPGPAPVASGLDVSGLAGTARVLLFAFLGGLVLNAMPCVFPVLAMKAMALLRLPGADRRRVRAGALSYTAGVLVAFGALGVVLLALRAAGSVVDWGVQFQHPAFVAATAWVLFLVGLNLSGVVSVGAGLAGAGGALAARGGHVGSFFTGLLAVVVATPCTAPFMGVAVAGALAAPGPLALLVFLVMGAGLAAPYLGLAIWPGLAAALPRPGRWMEVLKGGLAFPLYAAVVWLLWVVSLQAGPSALLTTAAGLLLLGFAAWAVAVSTGTPRVWHRTGRAAALAAGLAALALLIGLHRRDTGTAVAAMPSDDAATEPFSAARLAALRADRRPVFVDMTAAWCVSCLVNERVALSPRSVRDAFARLGVVTLRGDWTRRDPEITRFLHEHGRDGVPFYLYYPPGGDAVPLPQLLTASIVLDRIEPAR